MLCWPWMWIVSCSTVQDKHDVGDVMEFHRWSLKCTPQSTQLHAELICAPVNHTECLLEGYLLGLVNLWSWDSNPPSHVLTCDYLHCDTCGLTDPHHSLKHQVLHEQMLNCEVSSVLLPPVFCVPSPLLQAPQSVWWTLNWYNHIGRHVSLANILQTWGFEIARSHKVCLLSEARHKSFIRTESIYLSPIGL